MLRWGASEGPHSECWAEPLNLNRRGSFASHQSISCSRRKHHGRTSWTVLLYVSVKLGFPNWLVSQCVHVGYISNHKRKCGWTVQWMTISGCNVSSCGGRTLKWQIQQQPVVEDRRHGDGNGRFKVWTGVGRLSSKWGSMDGWYFNQAREEV